MSPLRGRLAGRDASPPTAAEEAAIVERLRTGDEQAFTALVDELGASMLRVARMYVRDRAAAEEVVQETWLAVLNGIDAFEQRSSLKTWIFRILSNRAKTRGEREGRSVPFSALAAAEAAIPEPAVEADRFLARGTAFLGQWATPPRDWPHERAAERETLAVIQSTIEGLPAGQREVIRLRDIEGWSAEEVAEALELSAVNQRVLLHRARSKVRAALEGHFDPELTG